MDMQELIRRAARHPTAAVTQDHEAAGAFRHGALGASDTDREPTHLVDGGDDRVAADQVAQPCGEAVAEPVEHRVVDIDMDVDPVAVPPRRCRRSASRERLAISTNASTLDATAPSRWNNASCASRSAVFKIAPWSASSSPRSSQRPSSRCHNDNNSTGSTTAGRLIVVVVGGVGWEVVGAQHPPQLRHGRQLGELTQLAHQPTAARGWRSAPPDPTRTHRRRTRRTSPATHRAAGDRHQLLRMRG